MLRHLQVAALSLAAFSAIVAGANIRSSAHHSGRLLDGHQHVPVNAAMTVASGGDNHARQRQIREVDSTTIDASVKMRGGPYGKTAAEWQGRRIYQIVTDRFGGSTQSCNPADEVYCGGTFNGIREHLDYITGMGFNAIWISPVIVNTPGGYHGYWAKDFFAVNPHFGTVGDLQALVAACHSRGVWVMIDVVINHVGPVGDDFASISPFNSSSHYHTDCAVTQYVCNTEMVWECRLASLPDLNQANPYVMQQLTKYVEWLMATFEFDGIRADTVMYVKQQYWTALQAAVGGYIVGEVWSSFECNQIYTDHGVDGTLNYPLFYTLRSVFQSNSASMRQLGTYWRQQGTLVQPNWETNFLDNQDNDRFLLGYANVVSYQSALAHMFFTNGIPCVYYGTEQLFAGGITNNECREALWPTNYNNQTAMYKFLASLNSAYDKFHPQNYTVEERWQDDSFYCYYRGVIMVCTTNTGAEQTRTIPNLPFAGMTVVNWLNQEQTWEGAATMTITIPQGQSPLILVGM